MEERPLSEHLHYAIANGDLSTVQQLLTKGADANQRFYIDQEVLETANRQSLSSLRQSVNSIKLLKHNSMPGFQGSKSQTVNSENNNEINDVKMHAVNMRKDMHSSTPKNLDELLKNLDDDANNEETALIPTIKTTAPSTENIPDEVNSVSPKNQNDDETAEAIKTNHDDPNEIPKRQSQFKILKIEMKSRSNTEESFLSYSKSQSGSESVLSDLKSRSSTQDNLNSTPECSNLDNSDDTTIKRKSLADLVDERLHDNNEILIERHPSFEIATDSESMATSKENILTDENQNKLIPRLKKKISFRFSRKAKKEEKYLLEPDEEDSYINFGPKARNVDDEQLNENFGGVAFFEAVREGMGMIVQTLLETSNNYQLNLPDDDGFTPVMQAAWHGQVEILQILLNHGANTSLQNATGCTAAHFAAGQGHTECLEILAKDQLVDINCQTKFGATPLILAAKCGYLDTVDLLLDYGADPNIQYRGKQNALLFAAGNGHYECIQSLLRHEVNVNQANVQNVTPLMRATQQGHNECVLLLTEHGADVNIQDTYGRTAAHFAVENGNSTALRILLKAGTDLDLKTKGGNTVQAYAERYQNPKCSELLENHINTLKEQQILNQDMKKEQYSKKKEKKDGQRVSCMKLSCINLFRKRPTECS